MQKTCDPAMCDHCLYIGDGDFICDILGDGPGLTMSVVESWEPTEKFLHCKKVGHRNGKT